MSKFQKFMFDNFIIKTEFEEHNKDESSLEQEELGSCDVEEIETSESSDAIEFFEMPEETYTIDEVVEDASETISYTEDEFQAAIAKAKAEGIEQGRDEILQSQEVSITTLFENVEQKLMQIFAMQENLEQDNEQKLLLLCRDIIKKLLPSMNEKYAQESIEMFLGEHFSHMVSSPKLAFYFNPEIISDVQSIIAKLANSYDFEGKISLHKDNSLAISDCRVEWEHGGVERREDKILDKIDELIENSSKTPIMES